MEKQAAANTPVPFPDVTLTEFRGVLYLHLGTDWIQGGMRLGKPNEIVIDYVQEMMSWMLFREKPRHIVQLGLGSAALTKFCHANFPDSRVTAVELNPKVIHVCRTTFHLPPDDERLNVLQADAVDYVESKKGKSDIDILQVDLYDKDAAAPLFDTPEFYQSCSDILTDDGIMTINIFGNLSNRQQSIESIQQSFDSVVWFPEVDGGNVIAMAFKQSPDIEFQELYQRAEIIRRKTKLKSVQWVNYLQDWMKEN